MPSTTPADVLARRRHLILSGDADGYADLFAPDGVVEAPFAPPGTPCGGPVRWRYNQLQPMLLPQFRHL